MVSFGIFTRPLTVRSILKKKLCEITKHFIIWKSVEPILEFRRCSRANPSVLCPLPDYEVGKMSQNIDIHDEECPKKTKVPIFSRPRGVYGAGARKNGDFCFFFKKSFFILTPLWPHLTRPRDNMWSIPRYHRSQHHPNQRFFLGDPESITRSGFTMPFPESESWNM